VTEVGRLFQIAGTAELKARLYFSGGFYFSLSFQNCTAQLGPIIVRTSVICAPFIKNK